MLSQEQELVLSEYSGLYDIVVPQDNLLRRINALIDFSFVYQELVDKYCSDNGRMAESPIRMFKYLLLKVIYDISDVDVVDRSRYDMSFKYFLGMAPEEDVINPSSLCKFRKLRLKDMDLMNLLIKKTVDIAIEKTLFPRRMRMRISSMNWTIQGNCWISYLTIPVLQRFPQSSNALTCLKRPLQI